MLILDNKMENTIEQNIIRQILADQKTLSKALIAQGQQIDKFDSRIEHIDKEQRDIQIRLGVIEKTMVTKDELISGLSKLKIDLIIWMIGLILGNTALIFTILKTFLKF